MSQPDSNSNSEVLEEQNQSTLIDNQQDENNQEDVPQEEQLPTEPPIKSTGQAQIIDSQKKLDRKKRIGLESITSLRVINNEKEKKRRDEDEEMKRTRLTKLHQEALTSAKANAAIEMRWAELMKKEIPQELHREIELQMESCNQVIKSKDDLINNFHLQLRAKDEEYVRALRQQDEDIKTLLTRIRTEYNELQSACDNELENIEKSYVLERENIINEFTTEIDQLFETRRRKEQEYKENKKLAEEGYQKAMDDLIAEGADKYNKLKIELELNIQGLKQQLEDIRATYQLNTEKLDYNYRVLTELDIEKNAELARYKRRQNKLKSLLNNIVTQFTTKELQDSKTNDSLTEDYRILTLKYKDLQAKFRHFEIADTTKYEEVWAMHEEEVKDLVDQLLKADKIITEQQLGYAWKAPDMNSLKQILGKHGGLVMNSALGGGLVDEEEEQKKDEKEENAINEDDKEETYEDKQKKIAGYKVRSVLKILASEAGFMINSEVRKSIENMPDEEADFAKAEAILKALGVKNEEKLTALVNYFFKDSKFGQELQQTDTEFEEEGDYEKELSLLLKNGPEEVVNLKDMIRPEDVITAVKAYMEDMSVETGPVAGAAAAVSSSASGSSKAAQEEARIAQKRLQSMRNYWTQLSQVVNDDTVAVWKQLETDCLKLKEMLSYRTQTIAEVDSLTQRNAELKSLLNQYLGDKQANSSLVIPPEMTLKFKDISSRQNARKKH